MAQGASVRPPRPAPLKRGDERSKAAWRKYVHACAKADEALRREKPGIKNVLNRRLN